MQPIGVSGNISFKEDEQVCVVFWNLLVALSGDTLVW